MESTPLPTAGNEKGTAPGAPRRISLPGADVPVAGLLLLFAIAFNLYQLHPEVAIQVPLLNDGVLHRLALERAVSALAAGQDPTDPWLAPVVMGYPLFHHYQHLPHVLPALLSFPLHGLLDLPDLFNWTRYLLLCLFPLSIYWSMRRFGFGCLTAALAGLVAPLLATNGLYGLDLASLFASDEFKGLIVFDKKTTTIGFYREVVYLELIDNLLLFFIFPFLNCFKI